MPPTKAGEAQRVDNRSERCESKTSLLPLRCRLLESVGANAAYVETSGMLQLEMPLLKSHGATSYPNKDYQRYP